MDRPREIHSWKILFRGGRRLKGNNLAAVSKGSKGFVSSFACRRLRFPRSAVPSNCPIVRWVRADLGRLSSSFFRVNYIVKISSNCKI